MKYLITTLTLCISLVVNSQIEVSISTMYRVPDSLSSSIHSLLPSDHPHKEFGWSPDDIYLNVFPYRESVINVFDENVSEIVFTIDTINLKVSKSFVNYSGERWVVSDEYISFYLFDSSGFFVELQNSANYSYFVVDDEICDLYKEMGHTTECNSQFVYSNEYNEIKFITKKIFNNLIVTGH